MLTRNFFYSSVACALALGLSACGGGGGGGVASIPPPPPAPPPAASAVSIFASPAEGQYASVGASVSGLAFRSLDKPLPTISSAEADQPRISYNAQGYYEIQFPGRGWNQLLLFGQGTPDTVLTTASQGGMIELGGAKDHGYDYSELASWNADAANGFGAFAFGTLTPSGGVPTTGSATYKGIVQGTSDVIGANSFDGQYRIGVGGTVTLNFDFAKSTLSGAMSLTLTDYAPVSLGTFAFKDTVVSAGSNSYSGKFDTSASGQNWFLGEFTGPKAQETIGAWALPFLFDSGSTTLPADHHTHEAFGAWIAKQ